MRTRSIMAAAVALHASTAWAAQFSGEIKLESDTTWIDPIEIRLVRGTRITLSGPGAYAPVTLTLRAPKISIEEGVTIVARGGRGAAGSAGRTTIEAWTSGGARAHEDWEAAGSAVDEGEPGGAGAPGQPGSNLLLLADRIFGLRNLTADLSGGLGGEGGPGGEGRLLICGAHPEHRKHGAAGKRGPDGPPGKSGNLVLAGAVYLDLDGTEASAESRTQTAPEDPLLSLDDLRSLLRKRDDLLHAKGVEIRALRDAVGRGGSLRGPQLDLMRRMFADATNEGFLRVQRIRVSPAHRDLHAAVAELESAARTAQPLSAAAAQAFLDAYDSLVHVVDHTLTDIRDRARQETALTVAGGVSLGSYQAGFLYYYTRFLQEYALEYRQYETKTEADGGLPAFEAIPVVTGASAGSINAFLAALTLCHAPVDDPVKSIFWRTWIDVGLKQLLGEKTPPDADVAALTIFSNEALDEAVGVVDEEWRAGRWSTDRCNARLGFTATRLLSRSVPVTSVPVTSAPVTSAPVTSAPVDLEEYRLEMSRMAEKFVLEMKREPGSHDPPVFGDLTLPEGVDARFYPKLTWDGNIRISDVTGLLLASSAFPVALQPRKLKFRLPEQPRSEAYFIDGGVLDNQPVRLARKLARWAAGARAAPETSLPRSYLHLFVDAGAAEVTPKASAKVFHGDDLVGAYGAFVGDFIDAAAQSEFLDAFEEVEVAGRLRIPRRSMPVAGEHFVHFSSFFEKDFRRADFLLGMADARDFLVNMSLQYWLLRRTRRGEPLHIDSPQFACYLDARTTKQAAKDTPSCKKLGPADANLVRVFDASRRLKEELKQGSVAQDQMATRFFELIDQERFEYDDFGSRHMTASDVRSQVREVFEESVLRLASRQKDWSVSKFVVSTAGNQVGNFAIAYRPPRLHLDVVMDFRRGAGARFGFPRLGGLPLRLSAGARIFNLAIGEQQFQTFDQVRTYAPDARNACFKADGSLVMIPGRDGAPSVRNCNTVTLDVQGDAMLTWEVYSRAVVQMEVGAGWAIESRMISASSPFLGARHGPRGALGLVFLQRLLLEASYVYNFELRNGAAYQRDDILGMPRSRNEFTISAGWRFLW